jgi:hypothetical protein
MEVECGDQKIHLVYKPLYGAKGETKKKKSKKEKRLQVFGALFVAYRFSILLGMMAGLALREVQNGFFP